MTQGAGLLAHSQQLQLFQNCTLAVHGGQHCLQLEWSALEEKFGGQ